MAVRTEIVKKLVCDACGWECDNSECCPMSGKLSGRAVEELHPEFLWFDGHAYCDMNGCNEERQCYSCGAESHDPWLRCFDCETWFCEVCFEKPEHTCERN